MRKQTIRLTLSGMLSALSVVLVILAGLIPGASYALPMLAGVLPMVLVIEANLGWAFAVYAVTTGLSILLAPDKSTAVIYGMLLGYYPIAKAIFERIPSRLLAFLPKLALFNAAAIGGYFVAIGVLGIAPESFRLFGVHLPWVFLLAGNALFVLYDFALSGLVLFYWKRLHPIIKKWMQG